MRETIYRTSVFDPERRYARMRVTPQFLFELCKARGKRTFAVTMNGLPEDVQLVGVQFDLRSGAFDIMVRSDTFAVVGAAVEPPELDPVVWTEYLDPEPTP